MIFLYFCIHDFTKFCKSNVIYAIIKFCWTVFVINFTQVKEIYIFLNMSCWAFDSVGNAASYTPIIWFDVWHFSLLFCLFILLYFFSLHSCCSRSVGESNRYSIFLVRSESVVSVILNSRVSRRKRNKCGWAVVVSNHLGPDHTNIAEFIQMRWKFFLFYFSIFLQRAFVRCLTKCSSFCIVFLDGNPSSTTVSSNHASK